MTDWVEPWSWTKNEVITAQKLNTIRQAILYLKETTDDYHRTARPIDHPDGSITPVKLDTINTPSDGQAPVYDGETGRFRWATGMGGVSRLSELIIDVDKDWAGYRIRNLGEPVDTGDALRLPWNHATRHLPGGGDPLSGLSRSQVSDFFSSPFWDNIPDKPSAFPPSAHAPTHQTGGDDPITSLDAGVITSGTLSLDRIPPIPPSKLDAVDAPADGEVPSYNATAGKFEWIAAGLTAHDKTYHVSPTLPDNDAHKTASPIDHPDRSVTRAKLEYPTVDVELTYLLAIGKAEWGVLFSSDANMGKRTVTVDSFTDKAVKTVVCLGSDFMGICVCRLTAPNNHYYNTITTGAATADHRIEKMIAGTATTLATEAVDLTAKRSYTVMMSVSGTTLKSFRSAAQSDSLPATPQLSATDTAIASGKFGVGDRCDAYTNYTLGYGRLLAPASPSPKAVGYYEVPLTGSGVPITSPDGLTSLPDPFRPALPEVLETPSANELDGYPTALKQAILANREGKVNRIAVSWSALIPTDPTTGKPLSSSCLVRVFEQPDRQPHLWSIAEALSEIEKLPQVKKYDERSVRTRAKQLDPKLKDKDLEEW
jgi:hypothetical protein